MSRYNQFAGGSSKLNVTGADTVEGRMVLSMVTPLINSWVARNRLMAEQSEQAVVCKHLTTSVLRADWTRINGAETLDVQVFSVPPSQERTTSQERLAEQFPEPPPIPQEEFSISMPTFEEIEQIQIANELPPQPPQLIKCFVMLFDDDSMVVYDMRSLERGLANQTPLIRPRQLASSWELPFSTEVPRLRDYYLGSMNFERYLGGRLRYTLPYTLQMTNSLTMGPVSISSIKFTGDGFQYSPNYTVYRLRNGFKYNAPLEAYSNVGHVGCGGGFPALMATDNMIYACTQTFTINEDGTLAEYGSDVWGKDGQIEVTYSLPKAFPLVPNFIDRNGQAHWHLGWPIAAIQPSMGGQLYAGFNVATDWNPAYISTGSGVTGSGLVLPAFTQSGGVDILDVQEIDFSESNTGTPDFDATYVYGPKTMFVDNTATYLSFVGGCIITVPYPPAGDFTFYELALGGQLKTIFGQTFGPFQVVLSGFERAASSFEVMNGFMQVSNGRHNLQGFVVHDTVYSIGDASWPLKDYFFFLDGDNITATLETACGTTADKIQYAFMDVPLFSVATIKFA